MEQAIAIAFANEILCIIGYNSLPRVKYHSSASLRTAKTFLRYVLIFRMFAAIYVMSSL